jgi:hypothetical protein
MHCSLLRLSAALRHIHSAAPDVAVRLTALSAGIARLIFANGTFRYDGFFQSEVENGGDLFLARTQPKGPTGSRTATLNRFNFPLASLVKFQSTSPHCPLTNASQPL